MKIEILKSKGQYYFRIRAKNGKILCHSEKYKRKNSCVKSAKSICDANIWIVDLTEKKK